MAQQHLHDDDDDEKDDDGGGGGGGGFDLARHSHAVLRFSSTASCGPLEASA
jgi:hypothetical protein